MLMLLQKNYDWLISLNKSKSLKPVWRKIMPFFCLYDRSWCQCPLNSKLSIINDAKTLDMEVGKVFLEK